MQLIEKTSRLFIYVTFFMLMITVSCFSAEVGLKPENDAEQSSRCLAVTYFHNAFRCPTCHRIEELSGQAVRLNFSDELKSGKVVWRVVNVDEPGKKHYVKDYQLYTKSLIVSEVKDGREIRWKNLKKVWTLVRSEEKFDEYVKTEIKEWLKE